jgi:hypothetical protein
MTIIRLWISKISMHAGYLDADAELKAGCGQSLTSFMDFMSRRGFRA